MPTDPTPSPSLPGVGPRAAGETIEAVMERNAERLAAISVRALPLMNYDFLHGERINCPMGCYPVQGIRKTSDGTMAEHRAKVMRGDDEIRGPSAYFTAQGDAESYATMANDLAWLVGAYRRLERSIAATLCERLRDLPASLDAMQARLEAQAEAIRSVLEDVEKAKKSEVPRG